MMHKDKFNLDLLPLNKDINIKGSNLNLPTENNGVVLKKAYYDHFISKNYEIIILNIHTILSGAQKVLEEQGFTLLIDGVMETEKVYLAYRPTSLSNTYRDSHNIVMCVYYSSLNTAEEINYFLTYYKNQGVDKVFMYYFGEQNQKHKLPQYNWVEYLDWNFTPHHIFFVEEVPNTKELYHYSQVPLYNMFIKKISPHCNWTFFCDLDEYAYASLNTLESYLQNQTGHRYTDHRYSNINFKTNEIIYEKTPSHPGGRKTIVDGKILKIDDIMGVHLLKFRNLQLDKNLLMFHNKPRRKIKESNHLILK